MPRQNDIFYDLGGAIGWMSSTLISLYYPSLKLKFWDGVQGPLPGISSFAPRQILLSAAVGIWSLRLGSFLAMVGYDVLNVALSADADIYTESYCSWRRLSLR